MKIAQSVAAQHFTAALGRIDRCAGRSVTHYACIHMGVRYVHTVEKMLANAAKRILRSADESGCGSCVSLLLQYVVRCDMRFM